MLRKRPGLSGPIDDAFIDPFLIVLPSRRSSNGMTAVDAWAQCEAAFSIQRWKELMRGEPRVKLDRDVSESDLAKYHIVLWGTPESNSLMQEIFESSATDVAGFGLPLKWDSNALTVDGQKYSSKEHVPLMIYPNPLQPNKYVILNSGLTFRPAHDRTNSLQNPHLPDWAILSLAEPPNAESAGAVVDAGFFDDGWQYAPMLQ